jgi:hypothetical protein
MKYYIGATAVVLLIAAGTLLPEVMAVGRDKVILGQVLSAPLDAAETSDYVNISMVDKASLMGQMAGTATYLRLATGAGYDQDSVRAKFHEELGKLYEMGFYPIPVRDAWRSFSSGATLYIQNDAPAISMIVWEIGVRTENLDGTFHIDDQTGKILSFSLSGKGYGAMDCTEEMVRAWAAYLGADVRNIKKDLSSEQEGSEQEAAYLFELFSGFRGAGGRMSTSTQSDPDDTNRRSLNYL